MPSSGFWLVVIAVGAVLVALGNIQWQLAKERETQAALASEARVVLAPEVTANLAMIDTIEGKLTPTQVPLERFQTAAWQTVSAGELVRGLRGENLAKVARAYELAALSNATLDRLVEFSVGVSAAMRGVEATRATFRNTLSGQLEQLRGALAEVQVLVQETGPSA